MPKVLLVRHGETIWNNQLRYQGHTDIPLSEIGRQQAERLALRLKNWPITAFYASDLSRAQETAQIIAKYHQKSVVLCNGFRETKFGAWEGLTYKEIAAQFPDVWNAWQRDPVNVVIPQGESVSQVADRAWKALQQILCQHRDDDMILIASHGGTIRLILARALQMNLNLFWNIRQDNTALNIIDAYNDRYIISLVNDTSHLEQI